jgi:hypothetical protein
VLGLIVEWEMKAGKKLKPGEPGTKKLWREYGEHLFCVRYRYDAEKRKRLKTVELIIEEAPWQPEAPKISLNPLTRLRIQYGEIALRAQVKAAGGKWNHEKKTWELPYQEVLKLGLTERIIEESLPRGLL